MSGDVKEEAQRFISLFKQWIEQAAPLVSSASALASKSWQRYRASLFQGYVIGAVLIFLILAVLAKTVAYFTFDVLITREVQEFNVWWFDAIMDVLSWIGFGPQAWVISAVILLFMLLRGLKWETLVTFVSLIGSTLLGLAIKFLIDRPRPSADLVNVVSHLNDYSFPSGHVLYFTTFFGFLLFLVFTLLKPLWWRIVLMAILGGMIALIGASRIYEGHHWASDVIAAYLLGSLWLSLTIYIYRRGKTGSSTHLSAPEKSPAAT